MGLMVKLIESSIECSNKMVLRGGGEEYGGVNAPMQMVVEQVASG